jgi:hypothetical protein
MESVTGLMPFSSLTLVADKVLGVHKDTRNMMGGATFVSIMKNSAGITTNKCYNFFPSGVCDAWA